MCPLSEFEFIIEQLEYPDDDCLIELKNLVLSTTDERKIQQLIDQIESQAMVLDREVRYKNLPYLYVFLSYCCHLRWEANKNAHRALLDTEAYILRAFNSYTAQIKPTRNQAMTMWYIGLLYRDCDQPDECQISLETADQKLAELETNENLRGHFATRDAYRELRKALELQKKEAHKHTAFPHTSRSASYPLSKFFHATQPNRQGRSGSESCGMNGSSLKNPGLPINFKIPVEIHNTNFFDPTIAQSQSNPQQQESNQDQDCEQSSKIKFINLFPGTKTPEILNLRPKTEEFAPENSVHLKETLGRNYITAPGLPVWGRAKAGPDGLCNDGTDEKNSMAEISLVQFDNQEFDVFSLSEGDKQIKISRKDFLTSQFTPEECKKINLTGKRYGWLKVVGDSMNKCVPVTIEAGDYVLFYGNDLCSDCAGRVVIASLNVPVGNEDRTMVKRLVKVDKNFVLRSESSGKDPVTGLDYQDLPLSDCLLNGQVVAVAKPRKSQPESPAKESLNQEN